jgi:hypothetical protein
MMSDGAPALASTNALMSPTRINKRWFKGRRIHRSVNRRIKENSRNIEEKHSGGVE